MAICSFNNVTVKTDRATQINTDAGTSPFLDFYTGPPPNDASMTATGTKLASLPCSSTFGVVTAGVSGGAAPKLTANAITTQNGLATGMPGYARLRTAAGVGVVDLDVGASGSNAAVIMIPDEITLNAPVSVSSVVINEP